MSRRRQLLKLIAEDVRRDLQDYPALRELLERQHTAMLRRDAGAMESLNTEIGARLEDIRTRAQRRSKVLRAFGLELGAAGMQRLFAAYPPLLRQELESAWAKLARLAAECKQLNERNGKLLAMQNEILAQLLGEQSYLYSPQAL
ncbi:MAG: flagellar protein FlgN [Xanthomonadaceae bacterium]|nr:flagellar protein FlgN [Xanthomonadaceae bacterium]